jgi:hypothetical protein
MERKDGFGSDEDIPTSHKTKRVMDAIFGKSGANPFVNTDESISQVNQDDEDEDYE